MLDLNKITDWKVSLGLLPINLFPNSDDEHNYILLNGGAGDFCLQISGDEKQDDYYYSSAWSSNTKNFVSVEVDIVKLYNWRKRKVENIKKSSIEDNYVGFYKYLLHNSVNSDY